MFIVFNRKYIDICQLFYHCYTRRYSQEINKYFEGVYLTFLESNNKYIEKVALGWESWELDKFKRCWCVLESSNCWLQVLPHVPTLTRFCTWKLPPGYHLKLPPLHLYLTFIQTQFSLSLPTLTYLKYINVLHGLL